MKTNLADPGYSLHKMRCFIINLCRTLRRGRPTLFEVYCNILRISPVVFFHDGNIIFRHIRVIEKGMEKITDS